MKGEIYMATNVRVNVVDVRNGLRLFRAGGMVTGGYCKQEQRGGEVNSSPHTSTRAQTVAKPGLKQMQFSTVSEVK